MTDRSSLVGSGVTLAFITIGIPFPVVVYTGVLRAVSFAGVQPQAHTYPPTTATLGKVHTGITRSDVQSAIKPSTLSTRQILIKAGANLTVLLRDIPTRQTKTALYIILR